LSYSKAWIDYNNDSFFSNDEMIYEGTHSGEENDSAIFTIPSNAEKNKFLRLRASLDLDPIDGPCYEPKYGQVEDYSVYLFSPEVANFVNQETNSKKLTVYPNPVKSILTIELYYGDFFNAKLFIRDLHGKLIDKELIISKSKFSKNIDVSGYQKGIYNVSIQNNFEIISQNFVVK
jgi:hypothetical protein